ncbi:MAG: ABC transporter permease subunit, partial [Bacteroidales bacterium]
SNLTMLSGGKTFAVPTGTVADQFVKSRFPDAKIIYLNSVLDCALAVKSDKADAAVYDQPVLKNIAAKNEGITVLPELIESDQYGFAVQMQNVLLKNTVDSVLAELKSNGIYKAMIKRWFPKKGNPEAMPEISFPGNKGILRFGTAAVTEPMSFLDANHKIAGFDIEFASYVAKKLGYKLEVIDMEFGAMLPALIAGKVDMIGAGLSITKERAKKVLFSECYYPSGIAVLVKDDPSEDAAVREILRTADDIGNKRIGVLLGSIHDTYAAKNFPEAEILQYQNVSDMLNAINSGKVDAAFYDDVSLKEVFKKNSSLGILAKNVFTVPIGAGFNKESRELRDNFDAFIAEIKSNGVYDDMVDRWMNKGVTEMPMIPVEKIGGSLKVGVVGDLGMPFALMQHGKLVGFDIELSTRFAASMGKEFIPLDMPFGSLIASLSTKKIDIITASMMITDERKKKIDFSQPYCESGVNIIALKSSIEPAASGKLTTLDDIADKRIGIFTGTVHDAFIGEKWPKAQVFRFESRADLMTSVRTGKIDAAMFDLITARLILKHNPDLGILSEDVLTMPLGVGFNKNNPSLLNDFNTFLAEIRKDGTYDTIRNRWFVRDAEQARMPAFTKPGIGCRKLLVGVSVNDLPYVSFMNGEYVGFDIELIRKFAERRKYQLEIISMEFPSLVAALASGKVEMITDGIAISKERGKAINFSDAYAEFRTAVVAPKKSLAGYKETAEVVDKTSFIDKVAESFYNNIILEKRYLLILDGLLLTIIISILAALFGSVFGGFICFVRMSKKKSLSLLAKFYISILRGTPVLVLLMIIYYVVFASVNINPIVVAVLAFGLNFAAYVSEMFRTSIESIDKGQKEAGIASGFTKVQTFIYIIMPQALRQVLPVYKGEFISLVKMTSIVGYIAVQDLTKAGDIIRSRTFDAFFPLIMAAVIYLVIAWLLTWALDKVEVSVDPRSKRIKREKEAKA